MPERAAARPVAAADRGEPPRTETGCASGPVPDGDAGSRSTGAVSNVANCGWVDCRGCRGHQRRFHLLLRAGNRRRRFLIRRSAGFRRGPRIGPLFLHGARGRLVFGEDRHGTRRGGRVIRRARRIVTRGVDREDEGCSARLRPRFERQQREQDAENQMRRQAQIARSHDRAPHHTVDPGTGHRLRWPSVERLQRERIRIHRRVPWLTFPIGESLPRDGTARPRRRRTTIPPHEEGIDRITQATATGIRAAIP